MCLVDLFPFAVDAECFRQRFDAHVAGVKEELVSYLTGRRQGCYSVFESFEDNAAQE